METVPKFKIGDTVMMHSVEQVVRGVLYGVEYDGGPVLWRYYVHPADKPATFPLMTGEWVSGEDLSPLAGKASAAAKATKGSGD